jgi:hypothetical protein
MLTSSSLQPTEYVQADILELLCDLAQPKHLTLTVELPYRLIDSLEEDPVALGEPAVETLAEECSSLRSVRLVFNWQDMDECTDSPVIVEYDIHRSRGTFIVKSVAPRLLEGTIFEFVEWR